MTTEMKARYQLFAALLFYGVGVSSAIADASPKYTLAGTGLDQRVSSGARVVLRGAGWTTTDRVVRFAWAQVAGPGVRLHDANRSTASFIAPSVKATKILKFRLTVTDIRGGQGSNTVTITVEPRSKSRASGTPRDMQDRVSQ
jgi:hypothetical protein